MKILIVDDDEVVRTGLKEIIDVTQLFELTGEATNGVEFLSSLASVNTEIVILDLSMPGMYGTEVARKALEIKPSLKIIIFSANVEKEELAYLLEMGIFGYILKTEGFGQILKALRNAANGLPYFSPELVGQVIQHNIKQPKNSEFTKREVEILGLMCKGLNPEEIADKLYVSNRTIEKHRSNMLNKTRKESTLELILFALKTGIVNIEKIEYQSYFDRKYHKKNNQSE